MSLIKMDDGSLLHLLSSSTEPFFDFGLLLSRCSEIASRADDKHLSCTIKPSHVSSLNTVLQLQV